MKATIRRYVYWKRMDKDIDSFVKECHVCSIWSKSLGEHPFPTISEPSATVRFDTLQIDLLHLPRVFDADHIKYITALSIIDMATGFPVVVPLRHSNDMSIKFHFSNSGLTLFGPPNCLIADNAHQFSLLFDLLKHEFGTIIQTSAAYHSRSHGKIERVHSTIQERLVKECASLGSSWLECLPQVLYSIRMSVNTNNISPYELVFGSPPPLAMHGITPPHYGRWSALLLKNSTLTLVRKLKSVLKTTTKKLPKSTFNTGDWVKITLFQKSGPKGGNLSGPYCVLGQDLRGNVFLSNGMIRHASQISNTKINTEDAERVQQMLENMYISGKGYYLDIEGNIQAIPENKLDLLNNTLPSLASQAGTGHSIGVFDNTLTTILLLHEKHFTRHVPNHKQNA